MEELNGQAARMREVAPDLAAGFALAGFRAIARIGLFPDDLSGGSSRERGKSADGAGSNGSAENPGITIDFDPPKPWETKWLVMSIENARHYWGMDDELCRRVQRYLDLKTLWDWRSGNIHEGYHINCGNS